MLYFNNVHKFIAQSTVGGVFSRDSLYVGSCLLSLEEKLDGEFKCRMSDIIAITICKQIMRLAQYSYSVMRISLFSHDNLLFSLFWNHFRLCYLHDCRK